MHHLKTHILILRDPIGGTIRQRKSATKINSLAKLVFRTFKPLDFLNQQVILP